MYVQSIEPVALWQFMVASICMMPKLFAFIFVSSRIAAFSDGKQRGEMDTRKYLSEPALFHCDSTICPGTVAKVINGLSIGLGILILIGTGAYVTQVTCRFVIYIVIFPVSYIV